MLTAPQAQARLDARVATRLPTTAAGLSLVFGVFAVFTASYQPPGATVALLAINGGGAALMALLSAWFRWRPVPSALAQPALALLLAVALAASLAAIKLLHLAVQTTNVMLVMVAAGSLFLNLRLATAFVGFAFAAWMTVFLTEAIDERWLNALVALVATTIVSVLLQVVRVREAVRVEHLLADVQRKTDELQEANANLEAFTYVVAHDLKVPVRATRAYLDEAIEAESAAQLDEHLERASASLDSLQRLVAGLLQWSRVTTEPLLAEPVRVQDVLTDPASRAQFGSVLQERGAALVVDPALPAVLGTPALVRQALGNLILNAVRHNPSPTPRVEVRKGEGAPPGMVAVVVADNGPGFPPEVLERVAAMGPRPSTVQSGFGLSITHRAVARLGGRLFLANGPRGGEAHVHLRAAGRAAGSRPGRSAAP